MISVRDYIAQRFQTFGISVSEADFLDIVLTSNLELDDEVNGDNHAKLNVSIVKFIPILLMRATSVSEGGFSMSWDVQGLKTYYTLKCKEYGLKDEINTDKPKVSFL